jgi:dTDP-4-amino-4,6-dideoxygalactose transaminase
MPIFKEIPPTAGFPFRLKDIFYLFANPRASSLESDFKAYLGVEYIRITYSGTAALYLIFEALKKISSRRTVVIPAYVCPLVALAAQKANLTIKVCDINTDNFDFNYAELERTVSSDNDILAIMAVHLAGLTLNFAKIKMIAEKYSIFTIEDCAHSLGAYYNGKKTGTLADFSFFSLCRGKGLTIYEGGVLVTNRTEYFSLLDEVINSYVHKNYFSESLKLMELLGYWIFYRPQLFWFVFKLPQLFWKQRARTYRAFGEEYSSDFDYHRVSFLRKMLGHSSFYRMENEIDRRRQKARYYIENLSEISGLKIIPESYNEEAAYPFLTVLFDDAGKRNQVLKALDARGLGVSIIYVNAICDYDYLKNIISVSSCLNARSLSSRQLTLSTSVFLKNKDLKLIVKIIKKIMGIKDGSA